MGPGKNRSRQHCRGSVNDTSVQVAVDNGERQSAAPEHLSRPFPSAQRLAQEAVAEVIGGMHNIVGVEAVANVVIRVPIIARSEALGTKLVKRKAIGTFVVLKHAAIGEFIQGVRPGVVCMGGKPFRKVMPDADRQTGVIRYRSELSLY